MISAFVLPQRLVGDTSTMKGEISPASTVQLRETVEFVFTKLNNWSTHGRTNNVASLLVSEPAIAWNGISPMALPAGVLPGRYHLYRRVSSQSST